MMYPALLALMLQTAAPLPELKVEAADGGSVLNVRNPGAQPVTAFLIELVGYPGSGYQLWVDDLGREPIAPGATRRIPITNMTVGAAPEYVKLQAALYAGGGAAGSPEKITELVNLRKQKLATAGELAARIEMGEGSTELRGWAESIPAPARAQRNTPQALLANSKRDQIRETAAALETRPKAEVLKGLKALIAR
jgi:hypothetical protein